MKFFTIALLCAAVFTSGCATGPTYAEMKPTIPAVAQGKGRIFLYRTSMREGGVMPAIKLNGETIGQSSAQGFFYVDRAPGDYLISTETEAKNEVSFHLDENETKYIRTKVTLGVFMGHVVPELISPEEALKELDENREFINYFVTK